MFKTYTLTSTELEKYNRVKSQIKSGYKFTVTPINDLGWDCLVNGKSYGGQTKGDAVRLALSDILAEI